MIDGVCWEYALRQKGGKRGLERERVRAFSECSGGVGFGMISCGSGRKGTGEGGGVCSEVDC